MFHSRLPSPLPPESTVPALGIRIGDVSIGRAVNVPVSVQVQTQISERVAHASSHLGRVLADAACEYECIHAAEYGGHATNGCTDAMYVHIERQLCPLVSIADRCEEDTHVA